MTHSIKKKLTLICMMIFALSLSVIVLGQNTSAATTYTVTLNGNGGSPNIEQRKVVKDGTYGALTTPSRKGYTFKGWYTKVSGGSKVTSSSPIIKNANHTLYAHWKKKEYSVYLDANGGSPSCIIKVKYNGEYTDLTTPTRSGYTFLGWYTKVVGGTKITNSTKIIKNGKHTLYARWMAR